MPFPVNLSISLKFSALKNFSSNLFCAVFRKLSSIFLNNSEILVSLISSKSSANFSPVSRRATKTFPAFKSLGPTSNHGNAFHLPAVIFPPRMLF